MVHWDPECVKSDSVSHVFDLPTLMSCRPFIKSVDAYKSRQAVIFHSKLNLQGGSKWHAISKTSSHRGNLNSFISVRMCRALKCIANISLSKLFPLVTNFFLPFYKL